LAISRASCGESVSSLVAVDIVVFLSELESAGGRSHS
jgi:hypothetical protein